MCPQRRRQAVVLCALIPFLVLLPCGCTPLVKGTHQQATPLTLINPTSVTSAAVSLTVGTNRLGTQDSNVEEVFLPVAVTVRNASAHTLCGGVHTAVLGDPSGASVSATLPEEVVTRLFGPLASLPPLPRPAALMGTFSDAAVFLRFVHGSHGVHSGIGSGIGGFSGRAPQPPYLRPSPRVFMPPFGSPTPFASPFSPFSADPFSPFYRRSPRFSPYGYAPYSPYSSPLTPFNSSPLSPFYQPFPPLSPYGSTPYDYGYPPLLPDLRPPAENRPTVDSSLIKEILRTAFPSRPLASQEERSGFLFFPLPVPNAGATMLTWSWYDCFTHELVAYLSVPVAAVTSSDHLSGL